MTTFVQPCKTTVFVRFAAKPTDDELATLKRLVWDIPALKIPARSLSAHNVSIIRRQSFRGAGLKGWIDRLKAVPAALPDITRVLAVKLGVGRKPFIQWIDFKSSQDAIRWESRHAGVNSRRIGHNFLNWHF